MKNASLFLSVIAIAMLQSCKDNDAQKPLRHKHPVPEKATLNECYTAIYEQDTLRLALNTAHRDKVIGTLVMSLFGMPEKTGKIAGGFHGDTLMVSYTFTQGANTKRVFKNPMALLKRGSQLILGNGEIETTMGASYFVKGKPIDFDHVKYKFTPSECGDAKQ